MLYFIIMSLRSVLRRTEWWSDALLKQFRHVTSEVADRVHELELNASNAIKQSANETSRYLQSVTDKLDNWLKAVRNELIDAFKAEISKLSNRIAELEVSTSSVGN